MKEFIEHFKSLTKVSDGLEMELISKSIPITVNKVEFTVNLLLQHYLILTKKI